MEALSKPRTGSRRKVLKDETSSEAAPKTNGLGADTLLTWVGVLEKEEALVAAAKKRLNKARKLAINDGVEMKTLERVRMLADQDPEHVLSVLKREQQYAEWMGVPYGKQFDLLDHPTSSILSFSEREDRAFQAGRALGLTGKNPDEQAYPVDNEHHQRHLEGWHDGQKVLLDRIGTINMALDSEGTAEAADDTEAEKEAA